MSALINAVPERTTQVTIVRHQVGTSGTRTSSEPPVARQVGAPSSTRHGIPTSGASLIVNANSGGGGSLVVDAEQNGGGSLIVSPWLGVGSSVSTMPKSNPSSVRIRPHGSLVPPVVPVAPTPVPPTPMSPTLQSPTQAVKMAAPPNRSRPNSPAASPTTSPAARQRQLSNVSPWKGVPRNVATASTTNANAAVTCGNSYSNVSRRSSSTIGPVGNRAGLGAARNSTGRVARTANSPQAYARAPESARKAFQSVRQDMPASPVGPTAAPAAQPVTQVDPSISSLGDKVVDIPRSARVQAVPKCERRLSSCGDEAVDVPRSARVQAVPKIERRVSSCGDEVADAPRSSRVQPVPKMERKVSPCGDEVVDVPRSSRVPQVPKGERRVPACADEAVDMPRSPRSRSPNRHTKAAGREGSTSMRTRAPPAQRARTRASSPAPRVRSNSRASSPERGDVKGRMERETSRPSSPRPSSPRPSRTLSARATSTANAVGRLKSDSSARGGQRQSPGPQPAAKRMPSARQRPARNSGARCSSGKHPIEESHADEAFVVKTLPEGIASNRSSTSSLHGAGGCNDLSNLKAAAAREAIETVSAYSTQYAASTGNCCSSQGPASDTMSVDSGLQRAAVVAHYPYPTTESTRNTAFDDIQHDLLGLELSGGYEMLDHRWPALADERHFSPDHRPTAQAPAPAPTRSGNIEVSDALDLIEDQLRNLEDERLDELLQSTAEALANEANSPQREVLGRIEPIQKPELTGSVDDKWEQMLKLIDTGIGNVQDSIANDKMVRGVEYNVKTIAPEAPPAPPDNALEWTQVAPEAPPAAAQIEEPSTRPVQSNWTLALQRLALQSKRSRMSIGTISPSLQAEAGRGVLLATLNFFSSSYEDQDHADAEIVSVQSAEQC
mmetsp:Transcript_97526/g.170212  ORF Transcript_97526/g.170212 Transcript_97526/m.170212 type:complete len:898 (+) Transcript_97526:93-2786(+)